MVLFKREKIFFIITLLFISLSLICVFIAEPLYKEYTTLNRQINIKCIRLIKNLRLIDKRNIVIEEFKKYGQQFVPKVSGENMASVLSEIEKIGDSSGIYLSYVKPKKVDDEHFYKMLLVEIRFQATIQNLTKFIYGLENSVSSLKISHLRLNHKGADSFLLEGTIYINKILFL